MDKNEGMQRQYFYANDMGMIAVYYFEQILSGGGWFGKIKSCNRLNRFSDVLI